MIGVGQGMSVLAGYMCSKRKGRFWFSLVTVNFTGVFLKTEMYNLTHAQKEDNISGPSIYHRKLLFIGFPKK